MKPKYLYHGTSRKIRGKYLIPFKASDKSSKANSLKAVYATERKDIALGMALSSAKYTKSMGNYAEKPYASAFVRGDPTKHLKQVYLCKLSSKTFEQKPKGSHQWVSLEPIKVLSIKTFKTKDLNQYWRKASDKEKKYYYRMKAKANKS